jgi:hypothetical protein
MLEVTLSVLGAHRRKRFAQCLYQGTLRTGSDAAQDTFDLGERFLYRIEIR